MKKLIAVLALAALCGPAAALGKKPPPRAQILAAKNAAWACKALRTTMGTQAFLNAYGSNKKAHGKGARRNAMGKCVSQKVRQIRRAGLFEPATGTLTIAAAAAAAPTQSVTFAGKTGTGTEILLAPATGSAHSVEFGSFG